MNQDVEKLWELQTVLTALGEREKQLSSKPESFAAVDREWQTANAEMEKLQQQIDTLGKERRRIDRQLFDGGPTDFVLGRRGHMLRERLDPRAPLGLLRFQYRVRNHRIACRADAAVVDCELKLGDGG